MTTKHATGDISQNYRLTKRIQTLIGIVTGLVADNTLQDREVLFLRTWLTENKDAARVWPGAVIWARLEQVLADGKIDETERTELLTLLQDISGVDFSDGSATPEVTPIPLQHDVEVTLPGRLICHTGVFLFGKRGKCEALTESMGGIVSPNVTSKVDYLVVGTSVSPEWANQSYGRKIERAMELRKNGHSIAIVPEKSWLKAAGINTGMTDA